MSKLASNALRAAAPRQREARSSGKGAAGELLREWRNRRRLSQLELALEAGVSARHLSFVETGRSHPSRRMVLALAERLEVPLREQNALLFAAGFAPAFSETRLEGEQMAPVRAALTSILDGHEPYPGLIVDRQWEIVAANASLRGLLVGVAADLLAPPVNALRVTLHPHGLAPRIENFGEWSLHLLSRLHRQTTLAADPGLVELERELLEYPGVEPAGAITEPAERLFVPLRLRAHDDTRISLVSTVATFGTPLDITLEELSIESFFPADQPTRDYLGGN